MKPLRSLVLRACFLALILLSMGANVARADDQLSSGDGGSIQSLPEDPGF
jgi:hypothetical protein